MRSAAPLMWVALWALACCALPAAPAAITQDDTPDGDRYDDSPQLGQRWPLLSPDDQSTLWNMIEDIDRPKVALEDEVEKRKFSPWGGKRAFNPWGGKRAFNPWGGKRAFNPWGGKRAFNPWGGKRSNDASDVETYEILAKKSTELVDGDDEKRAFSPWGGKRAFSPWGGKRAFNPWGGKRDSQVEQADTKYRNDEKRAFNPWGGKRAFNPWGGKRAFNPWGGKRDETQDH